MTAIEGTHRAGDIRSILTRAGYTERAECYEYALSKKSEDCAMGLIEKLSIDGGSLEDSLLIPVSLVPDSVAAGYKGLTHALYTNNSKEAIAELNRLSGSFKP